MRCTRRQVSVVSMLPWRAGSPATVGSNSSTFSTKRFRYYATVEHDRARHSARRRGPSRASPGLDVSCELTDAQGRPGMATTGRRSSISQPSSVSNLDRDCTTQARSRPSRNWVVRVFVEGDAPLGSVVKVNVDGDRVTISLTGGRGKPR